MSDGTGTAELQQGQPAGERNWSTDNLVDVAVAAIRDFFYDDGPQWAAAVAYYSLLSAFPLLLAIASLAAYFIDPQWAVNQATQLLGQFMPRGEGQIRQIVDHAIAVRGTVSVLSIVSLLWTGTRVFGALTKALNIAFDVDEAYGFAKRTLIELGMVLSVGALLVLALASRTLLNLLWGRLGFLPGPQTLISNLVRGFIPGLLLVVAAFTIYRFVPRRNVDSRVALIGALISTILYLIARPLFLAYLSRFANYNVIYGSLAIVIVMVLWAWISSVSLLFGGEIASHLQSMAVEGRSAEDVESAHLKRAPTRAGGE